MPIAATALNYGFMCVASARSLLAGGLGMIGNVVCVLGWNRETSVSGLFPRLHIDPAFRLENVKLGEMNSLRSVRNLLWNKLHICVVIVYYHICSSIASPFRAQVMYNHHFPYRGV